MIERTLKDLSFSIINYIYRYHEGLEFSAEVLKSGIRFMENIPSYFDVLLNALSDKAIYYIQ